MKDTIETKATAADAEPVTPAQTIRPGAHDYSVRHEVCTVEEVGGLLGISVEVIRHAIVAGELQALHAGHQVVGIRRAEVVRWLTERGPGI